MVAFFATGVTIRYGVHSLAIKVLDHSDLTTYDASIVDKDGILVLSEADVSIRVDYHFRVVIDENVVETR